MKTLVLAEKPSVGRDIGRVLHCTPQGNGFLEGKDYIVTWGLGHLVTLKDPEGSHGKYQRQRAGIPHLFCGNREKADCLYF